MIGDLPPPTPLPIAFDGAARKADRDLYGLPNVLVSDNFRLSWGNAIPIAEEQGLALLEAFERSWQVEILEMGHPAPSGTEAYRLNVYVGDSGDGAPDSYGAAGYYSLDEEGYPMLVMAPATVTGPAEFGANTAAHEFYHAVQGSTGRYAYEGVSAWYWESTAMWIEAQVYPDHPDYASFLFSYAYLPQLPVNYFLYPTSGALAEYYQYGSFIFNLYISRDVADATLIRDTWLDSSAEPDPMVVMANRLAERGLDFDEVWLDHAARNVLWDYPDHDVLQGVVDAYLTSYEESANLVMAEVPAEGTNGFVSGPLGTMPLRYGSNTIRIATPSEEALRVQVRGVEQGDAGSPARWGGRIVRQYADRIEYEALPFVGTEASLMLEGVGDETAIWLVVGAWTDGLDPTRWETEQFAYEYAVLPGAAADETDGSTGTDPGDADESSDSDDGDVSTDSGEPPADSDEGSSTGDDAGATDDGDGDKGCGCASGSPQGAGLLSLLMLGFAAPRRRRTRSRPVVRSCIVLRASPWSLVLALACGTTADVEPLASEDGSSSADETSSSSGSSSTTEAFEDGSTGDHGCFDAQGCPDECKQAEGWRFLNEDGCSMVAVPVCAPRYDGTPEDAEVWWRDSPEGPLFLQLGVSCSGLVSPGTDGWAPCSGRDDEPAQCACFCAPSWCPSEVDRGTLEACELPEPCPMVWADTLGPSVDIEAARCVLEALRDRVPGAYGLDVNGGFGGSSTRWFVDGTQAQVVRGGAGDVGGCPNPPYWRPAERCDLAPSEYFENCLALLGTEQDCAFDSNTWVVDCVPEPATCPG